MGKILAFKKKGQINASEFEDWQKRFKPLDIGDLHREEAPKIDATFDDILKNLLASCDELGLGGKGG